MTKFIDFDTYMATQSADTKKRVDEKANLLRSSIKLAKLRQAQNLSQTDLAKKMEVTQTSVSKVESADNLELNTIQNYVNVLGGTVSITANMPDGEEVTLM